MRAHPRMFGHNARPGCDTLRAMLAIEPAAGVARTSKSSLNKDRIVPMLLMIDNHYALPRLS